MTEEVIEQKIDNLAERINSLNALMRNDDETYKAILAKIARRLDELETDENLDIVEIKDRIKFLSSQLDDGDLTPSIDELIKIVNDLKNNQNVSFEAFSKDIENSKNYQEESLQKFFELTDKIEQLQNLNNEKNREFEGKIENLNNKNNEKQVEFLNKLEEFQKQDENKKIEFIDEIKDIQFSENEKSERIIEEIKDFRTSAEEKKEQIIEEIKKFRSYENEKNEQIVEEIKNFKNSADERKNELLGKIEECNTKFEQTNEAFVQKLEEIKDETIEINKDTIERIEQNDSANRDKIDETVFEIKNELNNILVQSQELQGISEDVRNNFFAVIEDIEGKFNEILENQIETQSEYEQLIEKSLSDAKSEIQNLSGYLRDIISSAENGIRGGIYEIVEDNENKFNEIINSQNSSKDELKETIYTNLDYIKGQIIDSEKNIKNSFRTNIDKFSNEIQLTDKLDFLMDSISVVNQDTADLTGEIEALKINNQNLDDNTLKILDVINDVNYNASIILEDVSTLKNNKAETDADLDVVKNNIEAARNDLNNSIETAKENLNNNIESVKDNIKNIVESAEFDLNGNIEATRDDIKNNIKSNIETAKENLNNNIESVKDNIKNIVESAEFDLSGKIETTRDDIKNNLRDLQEQFVLQMLQLFDGISFDEETDEIINFVDGTSNEIKAELDTLKEEISKISNKDDSDFFNEHFNNLCDLVTKQNSDEFCLLKEVAEEIKKISSGNDNDEGNTYSLPDVESDLAKIRLILKELQTSKIQKDEQELDFSERFDVLNEDISSISKRTNKLILTSEDTNKKFKGYLDEFKGIMNHFSQKNRQPYIEQKLDSVARLVMSNAKSAQILNEAFMHFAQWIDDVTEAMSNNRELIEDMNQQTSDVLNEIDEIKENGKNNVKKLSSEISKMEEEIENLNEKFETKIAENKELQMTIEKQNKLIAKLEAKIDKYGQVEANIDDETKSMIEYIASQTGTTADNTKDNKNISSKLEFLEHKISTLSKSIQKIISYIDEE